MMRNSIVGGFFGAILGAAILAACGSGSTPDLQITVDALELQVQQLQQDLTNLQNQADAHAQDPDAHHPRTGRLALTYCIATVGTFPSRNLTGAVVAPDAGTALSNDPLMGSIGLFAGNFPPRGWLVCDGSLLQISQYQALFSILGATFGGDGRTTFGLPDLRGRAPVGISSTLSWGDAAD